MMKKLILFTVLLFTIQSLRCQEIDSLATQSIEEIYDFHFEKHKKQKKTGLIMLGSGLVATGAGYLIASNSGVLNDTGGFEAGTGLILVGSLTTIASIPVLISSGVNKRKASAYVNISRNELLDLTTPNTPVMIVVVKIKF